MNIWGPTVSGKDGVMNEDEVLAYVESKAGVGGTEWKKNVKKAAAAIMNHDGQGGGTDYYHKGKMVFHVSEGKRGRNQGVNLFFTPAGGINASIIGIGHHEGSSSYELEWHIPSWVIDKHLAL